MKKVITSTLIFLFFLIGCQSSTKSKINNDLVGEWYFVSVDIDIIVSTNSDQVANMIYSECNGGIDLQGDLTKSLKYLFSYGDNFIVTDKNYNAIFTEDDYIMLSCFDGMIRILIASANDEVYYINDFGDYSYDQTINSLIINSTNLYKVINMDTDEVDSNSVISVQGAIQYQTIDIMANMPMNLDVSYGGMESFDGDTEFSLKSNGKWEMTYSGFDGETESDKGTWKEVDGKLILKEIDTETGETYNTQFEYEIEDGLLSLFIEEEYCSGEVNQELEDCYEVVEMTYGLDVGSINSLLMKGSYVFSSSKSNLNMLYNLKNKFPILDKSIVRFKGLKI